MFSKIVASLGCYSILFVSQAFANPDSIVVPGDLRITGTGNGLVFPDGSIQYQAEVQGPQGPVGPANSLSVGTVTTGASGSQAAATITGSAPNQVLNLTIPQGPQGPAPQITVSTICAVINAQNAPSPDFCKAITAFSITNPATVGVISQTAHSIAVTLPSGTDVTSLTPAITHTGSSISPEAGLAQDFTNPVRYTVAAADSSTLAYNVMVTVAPWAACGDILTYAGDNYPTVQIGTQCWFAKNLNIGMMVPVANGQGTSCSSIQKYCYNDTVDSCKSYGGLYTWNQAMCGTLTEKSQGICPAGWHVPSDPEYVALTNYLGSASCSTYRSGNSNYCGSPAGDRMKAAGLCQGRTPCGDSGFNGLFGGSSGGNAFYNIGTNTIFWTSSVATSGIGNESYRSGLSIDQSGVDSTYFYSDRSSGRTIRCVKD
jgi:uncharacterized protein (TIGR02145 family)